MVTAEKPALPGKLGQLGAVVEEALGRLLPPSSERPESVHRAMGYALTSPGKRLRPVLTLVVAEIFGLRQRRVLEIACAVEMVHASSLILDDLPCMDDAALRRGRETTHRRFGESVALLASFGLLNLAFATVAERGQELKMRRYGTEDMVHHLAAAIGSGGLIGGQALDLESRPEDLDLELMEYIHSHKTGALFLAAGELGAMAADARRRDLEVISRFAKNLGLAFQISDDLLDVLATSEETGKDSGQDEEKATFVKLLGVEGAQALASELLEFAVSSLDPLGRRADPLRQIALFVRDRGR
ncbi:MAG: polyprenyl synthetase family protein [Deltaproteobacteria bacterium]|nr:polyprenyl synthetase family protein [Deltaproteobacteria bacterium]